VVPDASWHIYHSHQPSVFPIEDGESGVAPNEIILDLKIPESLRHPAFRSKRKNCSGVFADFVALSAEPIRADPIPCKSLYEMYLCIDGGRSFSCVCRGAGLELPD
jgi:hypothetical protein